jgi:hypothetical protein
MPVQDIVLSADERTSLLTTLAQTHSTDAAERMLARMGLSRERRRNFGHVPHAQSWAEVFDEFDNGAIPAPYRRILVAALEDYPYNPVFRRLAQRHGIQASDRTSGSPT